MLLDGVFNHVGRDHPAVTDPARRHWIRWDGDRPGTFEGHDLLVELDHTQDDVVAAGRRRDVPLAGARRRRVAAGRGLRRPPGVLGPGAARRPERFPDVYVVGEVIHGDYAGVVEASGMDAVTQYELWQGIWHGLAEGNLFETAHALERHDGFLDAFVPWTFVGNHDVTRIVDQVGEDLLPHALVLLLTTGGTPAVWSGDEFGWHGIKEHRAGATTRSGRSSPPTRSRWRAARCSRCTRSWSAAPPAPVAAPGAHRAAAPDQRAAGAAVLSRRQSLVVALNVADEPAVVPAAGELLAGTGTARGGDLELPAHGWAVLAP